MLIDRISQEDLFAESIGVLLEGLDAGDHLLGRCERIFQFRE